MLPSKKSEVTFSSLLVVWRGTRSNANLNPLNLVLIHLHETITPMLFFSVLFVVFDLNFKIFL